MRCSLFLAMVILLCPALLPAQNSSPLAHIASGTTVFIEPMGGFETDLTAAMIKKHVPLTITGEESKAALVITGSSQENKAGWAKTIFVTPSPAEHASIQVKDSASGQVVYAYAWDELGAVHGRQSAAEGIAKHLKEFIDKK